MAHLWQHHPEHGWQSLPLTTSAHSLPHHCVLRKAHMKGSLIAGESWFLFGTNGVVPRINGQVPILGAIMLRDRDEIVIEGERLFFSTEKTAVVRPLPKFEFEVLCARCKQTIREGELSVECPACGAWHHQTEELGCWSYAETCSLCDYPTALDAGYRWTPEGVWS